MRQSRQSQPVGYIAPTPVRKPQIGPRRQRVDLASLAQLSPPAIFELQRDAGNQAVTSVLQLQAAPVVQTEETIASRLKEARARLAKGDMDPAAWDTYRENGASIRLVAERIWVDELSLADIDPASPSLNAADRRAAKGLDEALGQRVAQALRAKFTALGRDLPKSTDRIKDEVEAAMAAAPTWSEGTIADRLWEQWVGPFQLSTGAPSGAKDFWSALRDAAGPAVKAKRGTDLSKDAVKTLDGAEIAAVETIFSPSTDWVVTPDQTAVLTDQVAAALGRPIDHSKPAWIELRGRMSRLILVAEANLINRTIPHKAGKEVVWPERWAEFRNRYVATLSKPMWTYYRDNIVDAEVLGTPVKASDPEGGGGVHRDVAAVLPLVTQSAMRLGGFSTVDELRHAPAKRPAPGDLLHGKNPITLPGTEFRFEAVSHYPWMSRASHLSFHGTGRAIDFRASTNPNIQGELHELVSVLGGGELTELPAASYEQRTDLANWAARLATLVRMRSDLERQLAAATDPDQKANLTSQLERVVSALKDAPQTHADAIKVKDRVTQSFQRIEAIEQEFRSTVNAMRATRAYLRLRHQEAPDLLAQLQDKVNDAAKAAQDELDQAKATKAPTSTLELRVKRISDLSKKLANPKTGREIAQGAEEAAHSGLTDLPLWFVQAFTEQGWQWGEWQQQSDAMHFDYMGPVADVVSQ